jgi:hypothetical protein
MASHFLQREESEVALDLWTDLMGLLMIIVTFSSVVSVLICNVSGCRFTSNKLRNL